MSNNHIFISYSHKNVDLCKKILSWLRYNASQLSVFLDEEGIPLCGDLVNDENNFNTVIKDAIKNCKLFIYLWTRDTLTSNYTRKELEYVAEYGRISPNGEYCGPRFCILQFDQSLNKDSTDLPGGVLTAAGINISRSWTDDLMYSALDSIKNEEYQKYALSDSLDQAQMQALLPDYFTKCYNKYETTWHIPVLKSGRGEKVELDDIVDQVGNTNIQLVGARGSGRSTILEKITAAMCKKYLGKDISTYEKIIIPVYVTISELWAGEFHIADSNLESVLCNYGNAPYCGSELYHYVFLVDGSNAYQKRGYCPAAISKVISIGKSNVLLSSSKVLVLPNMRNVFIDLLSFNGVRKVLMSALKNDVVNFLYKLCSPSFKYANENYKFAPRELYDKLDKIFNKFQQCARSDDFYSITLAKSTETKRLPESLTVHEIELWKRIIKRNSVFSLLRYPLFIKLAIDLYKQQDDCEEFPTDRNVFFYRVYTMLVAKLTDSSLKDNLKLANTILTELYLLLKHHEGSASVDYNELKTQIDKYDFGAFKELIERMERSELIHRIGNDVTFSYEFIYNIIDSDYKSGEDVAQAVNELLNARTYTAVMDAFFNLASKQSTVELDHKDPLELALNIYLDELLVDKELLFKESNLSHIRSIIADKRKHKQPEDYYTEASLQRVEGRLGICSDNYFCVKNTDIENSDYWVPFTDSDGAKYYFARYSVTFSDFKEFVKSGYNDEKYWEGDTRKTILLENGQYRIEPIDADEGGYPFFNISNHPVVGVTQFEAAAFCKWFEDKLNNKYKVALPPLKIYNAIIDKCKNKAFNSQNSIAFNRTTPVGLFSDSDNVCDLIGNVWEWCSDNYDFDLDRVGLCFSQSYNNSITDVHKFTSYPSHLSNNNIGFRLILREIEHD